MVVIDFKSGARLFAFLCANSQKGTKICIFSVDMSKTVWAF